jgi:hypothetical protein
MRYSDQSRVGVRRAESAMVSMGAVWDRTTEFLSDNLSVIMPIALLAIFVPVSISQSLAPLGAMGGAGGAGVNLASLALSIVSLWGQLAIMALALDPLAGRAQAVAVANRRLLPVIGIWLIIGAAILLLILPIIVALQVSGFDFGAAMNSGKADMPTGVGGFIGLYALFFLCAVIWLYARFILAVPVILMEGGWLGALARSFTLTRSIVLKIVGVWILYAIVAGVSFLAAKLVFGSILRLVAGGEGTVTVATVLTSILASVVLTVFTIVSASFIARLYLAVRDARRAIVESV